jgi:hypothetical protein
VAEGTLSWRLARARKMLAERLARRGVSLAGVAGAALLAEGEATAAVGAALAESTVRAALLVSAGIEVTSAAGAVALMKGVLRTMFMAKLKAALAVVVVIGVLGAGGFAYQVGRPAQAQAQTDRPAARTPTELDVLRKEVELLRLKLEMVEGKMRAQEARLQALEGRGKAGVDKKAEANRQNRETILEARRLRDMADRARLAELLRRAEDKKALNDARKRELDARRRAEEEAVALARDVQKLLNMLREARDTGAKQRAVEALEQAIRRLREHLKKEPRPDSKAKPLPKTP